MKYIAGIMIGAGITGAVWTHELSGPNGWAFLLAFGVILAGIVEIASHNGFRA